jgi:acetolactate synthase-1/2/3 large subunit
MDGIPLLVLTCGIRGDSGRAFQLHDIDQLALLRTITKGAFRPASAGEIYPILRRAVDLARHGTSGPVVVEIPADLYMLTQEIDGFEYRSDLPGAPLPSSPDVEAAAALLNAARQPLIYVGLGAASAAMMLPALAERLGAPVATTIQGKGVFPESHPLWLWNMLGASAPEFVRTIRPATPCSPSGVDSASRHEATVSRRRRISCTPQSRRVRRNFPPASRSGPTPAFRRGSAAQAVPAAALRPPDEPDRRGPPGRAR